MLRAPRHASRRPLTAALAALLALAVAAPAQTVFEVPGDFATIQAAVDAAVAVPGAVRIEVAGGVYVESLVIGELDAPLEIVGLGPAASTVLDGAGQAVSLVERTGAGALVLMNLTLRSALGTLAEGTHRGGAVLVRAGDTRLEGCLIRDCGGVDAPVEGGGAFVEAGSLVLDACTFEDCATGVASVRGGAVAVAAGTASLADCAITGCGTAASDLVGGAVWAGEGLVTITGGTIVGCGASSAVGEGGALARPTDVCADEARIFASQVEIRQCRAERGGAASGGVSLTACALEGNEALLGGALFRVHEAVGCTIASNTALGSGGGVYAASRSNSLRECVLVENEALGSGGGLYAAYTDFILHCANPFAFNVADVGTGNLFLRNVAGAVGGGAFLRSAGDSDTGMVGFTTVARCVFVENEAPEADAFYAAEFNACDSFPVFCFGPKVDNCTLVGDGFELASGDPLGATNMILRDPPPLPVAPGDVVLEFSNIEGGHPGTGNIDADPLFADPASDDYSLLPGSPCINTGDPAGPADPDGSPPDMGAIPFHPWTDLGFALDGSSAPRLDGSGPLIGDESGSVHLTGAPPSTPVIPVLGLSQILAPFKLGTLVPAPDLLPGMPLSGADGALSIPFTWPAGLPSGFEVVIQFWIPAGGGPLGWSASNGLLATTP